MLAQIHTHSPLNIASKIFIKKMGDMSPKIRPPPLYPPLLFIVIKEF